MVTLADLKAKHPEWCFNCGHKEALAPFHPCYPGHVIAALIAAKLEDEARIEELSFEKEKWMTDCWGEILNLRSTESLLTVVREAHEVTRKTLAEVEGRLICSCLMDHGEPYEIEPNCPEHGLESPVYLNAKLKSVVVEAAALNEALAEVDEAFVAACDDEGTFFGRRECYKSALAREEARKKEVK